MNVSVSNKKAFTMIELIFVIVIIGILAAVAIPKLAATRDDAKIVSALASGKQALINLGAEFTSQAAYPNYTLADANSAADCFNFTDANVDGNVTVTAAGTCDNTVVRAAVTAQATANGLIDVHSFGGVGVKF